MTFGSLPAPNRIRTISRISTTCQIPMLINDSLSQRTRRRRAGAPGFRACLEVSQKTPTRATRA
jgi:hypothetical protein